MANMDAVEAVAQSMVEHAGRIGCLGDSPTPQLLVWHLLVSLDQYCAKHNVDLDAELADARVYLSENAA